jgi:MFS family permease
MASTAVSTAKKASVLAVPLLGFMGGVQGSAPNVASTALVGASRTLEMTGSTQALAASMQTLAIAATVITTGLMADRLGRRRVLMAALIVGGAGTIVVSIAAAAWMYMLGLAIVGVGLGAVYGASFAYIKAVVRPERLAAAMGTFTAVVMVTTLVVTFIGGSLTSVNWRIAYLIFPVCSLIAVILVPILLPKEPAVKGGSLDVAGQLLLGLGVISFLYSVSQFAKSMTSPATLVPLAVGVVLLAAFAVWESKYSEHFFPMQLFRSPVFLAALCFGFIYNFGTSVGFLQVTNLWQYINGLKTSEVSLWQLPLMLAGIVAGLVTGRVMSKGMTNRRAGFIAGVVTAIGFIFLGVFHSSSGLLGFLPGLILVGAGVVIAAVPFGNLVLREAPAKYLGPVSSARTTAGQFFYTLGFALSTVLIDKLTTGGTVQRLTDAGVPPNQISTGLDAVSVYAAKGTQPTTSLGQQALADAVTSYGGAFRTTVFITAIAILLATALATALLRKGEGDPQPVHEAGSSTSASATA